jgi:bifunctional UDP-N-acetylglucosamine pyrophosphorylase / glucosamine-1-phosphate N-acetyltransferase
MPGTLMLVPAAGLGTRLKTQTPKVLQPVLGKAMIDWLLDLYGPAIEQFIVVLHPSFADAVRAHCRSRPRIAYARQESPTGMLDAILAPRSQVRDAKPERIWITWCDQVAVHPDTVKQLVRVSAEQAAASLIFPTARRQAPYVHIVRDGDGRIGDIQHLREGDVLPADGESDMGLFSLSPEAYLERLVEFSAVSTPAAQTRERNFLPFIPWLSRQKAEVRTFACRDAEEAIGINTAEDLAVVQRYLLRRGDAAARS